MMIQIEVQPETAALVNDAKTRGVSIDALLRDTLKQSPPRPPFTKPNELKTFLEAMAEGSQHAPVLPPEANERAFYYEGLE